MITVSHAIPYLVCNCQILHDAIKPIKIHRYRSTAGIIRVVKRQLKFSTNLNVFGKGFNDANDDTNFLGPPLYYK